MAEPQQQHREEHLNVLTRTGEKTGISKPRGQVHRDGDYHRAVHVWIYSESTAELLVKRRAGCKDPLSANGTSPVRAMSRLGNRPSPVKGESWRKS